MLPGLGVEKNMARAYAPQMLIKRNVSDRMPASRGDERNQVSFVVRHKASILDIRASAPIFDSLVALRPEHKF